MTTSHPAAPVVAAHLRELPNVALEAAIDLVAQGGPSALTSLIADEFCRRHPSLLRVESP